MDQISMVSMSKWEKVNVEFACKNQPIQQTLLERNIFMNYLNNYLSQAQSTVQVKHQLVQSQFQNCLILCVYCVVNESIKIWTKKNTHTQH